ncbi:MAG: HAD-IIA family hydrolase [Anaerolineaceae bacterium]
MNSIRNAKAFAIDMDGTFFLGQRLLPGALELLALLNSKGIPFSFLTNNSSKSPEDYRLNLIGLGVLAEDARVYTSGEASIAFIQAQHPWKRVYLLGTKSLTAQFRAAGVVLDEEAPEVAVLGYDTELTYPRLKRFCDLVREGLPYIATHPDINCPVEGGFAPDTGAFMALIEASTGRKADVVIGKPNPLIMVGLAERLGVEPCEMVMVGDRLYTDIALGTTAGVGTVLVLSGETSREDLEKSVYQPDLVCENLAELIKAI